MSRLSNFAKWKLQVQRKVKKWVAVTPEYEDYMPTTKEFRYPRPSYFFYFYLNLKISTNSICTETRIYERF
jgi:hypothetical protein